MNIHYFSVFYCKFFFAIEMAIFFCYNVLNDAAKRIKNAKNIIWGHNMNTKQLIKHFISRGAVIYTAGSILIMLISLAMSDTSASQILNPALFLYYALFSYILSLGSTLFVSGYFPSYVAGIIHAVCFNLGFLFFVLLCNVEFSFAVVFTLIFAVIYVICRFVGTLIRRKTHSNARQVKAIQTNRSGKQAKAPKPTENTYKNRFS